MKIRQILLLLFDPAAVDGIGGLLRDPNASPTWDHVAPASRADLMTCQRLPVSSSTAFAFARSASGAATSLTSARKCAAAARAWSLPVAEIEGAASYGAVLAGAVAAAGYEVAEATRMDALPRRGVGKSDPLDAHRIASAVLSLEGDKLRRPRLNEGVRAALRVLVSAHHSMTTDRTRTVNALTALLRINDLGLDARESLSGSQILEVSRWRVREEPLAVSVARSEAVILVKIPSTCAGWNRSLRPGLCRYLRQEVRCGLTRPVAAGAGNLARCLAAIKVLPHFEQFVDITAAECFARQTWTYHSWSQAGLTDSRLAKNRLFTSHPEYAVQQQRHSRMTTHFPGG